MRSPSLIGAMLGLLPFSKRHVFESDPLPRNLGESGKQLMLEVAEKKRARRKERNVKRAYSELLRKLEG